MVELQPVHIFLLIFLGLVIGGFLGKKIFKIALIVCIVIIAIYCLVCIFILNIIPFTRQPFEIIFP